MPQSDVITEYAAALAKAQAEFLVPKKSRTAKAGTFSYRYSTLDELIEATRPALAKHGLSVQQDVFCGRVDAQSEIEVCVTTQITHSSGQWWRSTPFALPAGTTPQNAGAACTYARRYSLGAALNVAAEEDTDAQTVQPAKSNGKDLHTAPAAVPPKDPARSDRGASARGEPGAPSTPAVEAMSPSGTHVVKVESEKPDGKNYTRYVVTFRDGRVASTIATPLGRKAEAARDAGTLVTPVIKPGKFGKFDLDRLDPPTRKPPVIDPEDQGPPPWMEEEGQR
jgi:hypothetical protein